jgi:hypothetical protein
MVFIRAHFRTIVKLYFLTLFLFLFHTLLNYEFIRRITIHNIETELNTFTLRVEKDFKHTDGIWDTSLYSADPLTPHPHGSSGFTSPLYVITEQGFVIERSNPIRGLLDTSDYKLLAKFEQPTSLTTATNERWRILSKKVYDKGIPVGIVVISYYNPGIDDTDGLDAKMLENINTIIDSLSIKNGIIITNKIDIRNIRYEFAFEVVDLYNNVLLNNGRAPTFLDPSYFAKEVDSLRSRTVYDDKRNEPYRVVSRVMRSAGKPIGVIVAGESLSSMYLTLRNYIVFSFFLSGLFMIPLLYYTFFIFRKEICYIFTQDGDTKLNAKTIHLISFDKKNSTLIIDEKMFEIPFASNQYYVCDALFSQPTKRWENDELLNRMGDDTGESNVRKVYDAVIALNKRVGIQIIVYKNRVFTFNKEYLPFLKK